MGRVPNRTQPNRQEATPLEGALPVNAKELDFAIQLFQAGLRMKIPVSVSEIRGVDFGDNGAAQTLIDAMPEELRARFVALEGRIIPRDPELRRGSIPGSEALRAAPVAASDLHPNHRVSLAREFV